MPRIQAPIALAALASIGIAAAQAACQSTTPEPSPTPPPDRTTTRQADLDALVAGNTQFALDLYARLGAQDPGNIFCAPQSISTALAMTYAGARAETAEQMARTLRFAPGIRDLHAAFAALAEALPTTAEDERKTTLAIANRLWGQRGESFLDSFLDTTRVHYGGGFETVDYLRDPEGARLKINAWTEQQTRGRIEDLLQPGVIDRTTVLVLTNAIHFKGTWRTRFDPQKTQDDEFHAPGNRVVTVPMMKVTSDFGYYESDLLQAVSLPFDGDRLEMVVLLPEARDGLKALEEELTLESLAEWVGQQRMRRVALTMPRFGTTSRFELSDDLAQMGMPAAFSSTADFSGMNGRRYDLFISNVVHKAFIEVNEEGAEAAAATGVVMKRTSAPSRPRTFLADHPFIYLIRDRDTGAILFLGRMVDPGAETE
jgi:serpin B